MISEEALGETATMGRGGSDYRNEPIPCTLSVDEIQTLIDERTVARRRRNFEIADEINELASKGVEVVDKENIWRTFDEVCQECNRMDMSGDGRRQEHLLPFGLEIETMRKVKKHNGIRNSKVVRMTKSKKTGR